jgi:hypothetical protein
METVVEYIKVKGKKDEVPVFNQVPRCEDVSCA